MSTKLIYKTDNNDYNDQQNTKAWPNPTNCAMHSI